MSILKSSAFSYSGSLVSVLLLSKENVCPIVVVGEIRYILILLNNNYYTCFMNLYGCLKHFLALDGVL